MFYYSYMLLVQVTVLCVVSMATYGSLHDVQQLLQHHGDALVAEETCYGSKMLWPHKIFMKF